MIASPNTPAVLLEALKPFRYIIEAADRYGTPYDYTGFKVSVAECRNLLAALAQAQAPQQDEGSGADHLSRAEAAANSIMQDYRWGYLTKLGVAAHLQRAGFRQEIAVERANALSTPPVRGEDRRIRHAKIIDPFAQWGRQPSTRFKGTTTKRNWDQFYVWDAERSSIVNPDGPDSRAYPWRKMETPEQSIEAADALNRREDSGWVAQQASALTKVDAIIAAETALALPDHARAGGDCHGLDTPKRLCFYEQDFYVLSNFSSFEVEWSGFTFKTSEHLYHWLRFTLSQDPRASTIAKAVKNAPSAHESFKIAQENKAYQADEWADSKVGFMRRILHTKADQHEYVRRKLLATGDRELVENSWRDDYWGWGPNRDGQNMLGKLWMEVRADLRAALSASPAILNEGEI